MPAAETSFWRAEAVRGICGGAFLPRGLAALGNACSFPLYPSSVRSVEPCQLDFIFKSQLCLKFPLSKASLTFGVLLAFQCNIPHCPFVPRLRTGTASLLSQVLRSDVVVSTHSGSKLRPA